ncbi:conserved hypothetical protein [uncultured Alphaproteobacteria bacterium]|uniref:Uncharacterized protein n=1 Tax=uncultured Alphaproteobacteria bacterium TaxID=91750 RepID=A0A212IVT0_9PROT|nr:conserved hypothetical protein [uncultured Alphaproteobacteria bacterium]
MPDLDFSKLGTMSDAEECRFMAAFTREIEADRGEEAERRLAAGRAIYYADDRYRDALVKELPDGSRQLVTFEGDTEVFIRNL